MSALSAKVTFAPSTNVYRTAVKKMSDAVAHRGDVLINPINNEYGAYIGRHYSNGIFTTEVYDSDDFTVAFDGKTSNLDALLKAIPQTGSTSNPSLSAPEKTSEKLLALYLVHGCEAFNLLRGSFTVVIHEKKRSRIRVFRDLFSGRPAFVAFQNDTLWFSTEIKGVLADSAFNRQLNRKVLPEMLSFGITMGPETLMRDIYKLPPGYFFDCLPGKAPECKILYLPKKLKKQNLPASYFAEKIWDYIGEGINEFIDNEQKENLSTALFLSGGVDSSLVALKQKELGIKKKIALSCSYDDEGVGSLDESRIAKNTAETCSMDFQNVATSSDDDLLESMKNIIRTMEEPTRFIISIPVERALKQFRGQFSCLITGMYADVFFGSDENYDSPIHGFCRKLPESLKTIIRFFLPIADKLPKLKGYAAWFRRGDLPTVREYNIKMLKFNGELKGLLADEHFDYAPYLKQYYEKAPELAAEDEWAFLGLTMYIYCWDEMFERLAGYAGADVIHPFKTMPMYELSLAMPYKGKIAKQYTKPYVRKLAADKFSPDLAYAEKQIFASPGEIWLAKSSSIREFAFSLQHEKARIHEYLNSDAIKKIILQLKDRKDKPGRNIAHLVYILIGFELWLREFLPEETISEQNKTNKERQKERQNERQNEEQKEKQDVKKASTASSI